MRTSGLHAFRGRSRMFNEMLANECWDWRGSRDKDGYGFKTINGWGNRRTHRLAWAWANGMWRRNGGDISIPADAQILHSCDNPACVNPAHLSIGSCADNMRDKSRKGRHSNSRKTHCPSGHAYVGDNLYVNPNTGHRLCVACRRRSQLRPNARRTGLGQSAPR
jgi:hypothetical protein